jgi:hypothetical protein
MLMAPELETLDRLSAHAVPVSVVRQVFDADRHFQRAILAMLYAGDIRMVDLNGNEVRNWEWQIVLNDRAAWRDFLLNLTEQGAKRI